MKCHYTYVKDVGNILIPFCWHVHNTGNISDCHCNELYKSYGDFEKSLFKDAIKLKDKHIALLESEIIRLKKLLK